MRPKCFVSIAECWMLRKQTQQSLKQLKLISLLKLSSAERDHRQCACVFVFVGKWCGWGLINKVWYVMLD